MEGILVKLIALIATTALVFVVAAPAQAQGPAVGVRLVADGMTSPITLVPVADGSGRRFIVDQAGTIRVLTADGRLLPTPFLDLRSRIVPLMPDFDERGVLGLAFHPGYPGNGRFFVYYSAPLRPGAPAGYDHTARLAEFRVSAANPNQAEDRKSTRLNSSHSQNSYAVFCLKKKQRIVHRGKSHIDTN